MGAEDGVVLAEVGGVINSIGYNAFRALGTATTHSEAGRVPVVVSSQYQLGSTSEPPTHKLKCAGDGCQPVLLGDC